MSTRSFASSQCRLPLLWGTLLSEWRERKKNEAEVEQCQPALLSKNRPAKCKHIETLIKVTDPHQLPSEIHQIPNGMNHTFWDQSWHLSQVTGVCAVALPPILFLHHAGSVLLLTVKLCQGPQISARWTGINYCGVCLLKMFFWYFNFSKNTNQQRRKYPVCHPGNASCWLIYWWHFARGHTLEKPENFGMEAHSNVKKLLCCM